MPKGKAPASVHIAAHKVGADIDCDLTELFQLKKEGHHLPCLEEQAMLCFQIQSAVLFYKNSLREKYVTSTQRLNEMRRFKLDAKELLKAELDPNSLLISARIRSFTNSFNRLDYTARVLVYNLFPCPIEISSFLNRFDLLMLSRKRDSSIQFLKKIADMSPAYLGQKAHHFPRPDLALLVRRVAPAFKILTGRSLLRSCNHYGSEERHYYFATWLRSLFPQQNHANMTDAMVEDIIIINKL